MKSRILILLVAMLVAVSPVWCVCGHALQEETTASDVQTKSDDGELLYEKLMYIADFIREYGIYSSEEDDPLKDYFVSLFSENPEAFDVIADSMLKAQDSHSGYYRNDVYGEMYSYSNSYVGIGITINATMNGFEITEISDSVASEDYPLVKGDIILEVNGVPTDGLTTNELVAQIRGEEGSFAQLKVLRGGEIYSCSVKRRQIKNPLVKGEVLEDGIYYIDIDAFDGESVYNDFIGRYKEAEESQSRVLILDMRDNPGGEIDSAVAIANCMIAKPGIDFVRFDRRDAVGGTIVCRSDGIGASFDKIIVLVNENSASASEFVAAGLRAAEGAEIVGTNTYGKATGQYHIGIDDDATMVLSMIKISVPGEEDYATVGITPDYYAENKVEYFKNEELLPLDETYELYVGNYSAYTKALNQRLYLLGFLQKEKDSFYDFDEQTLDALNSFRTANGMQRMQYADTEVLNGIKNASEGIEYRYDIEDLQMEKALEIAREALGN